MLRIIIVCIVIFNFISCSAQSDFIKTSNDLYEKRLNYDDKVKSKKFQKNAKKIRNALYKKGSINFFTNEEPLFILEGFDIQTGMTYTTIWNTKGSVSFENDKRDYNITDSNFSEKLKSLLENWNIEEVKKQEKEKGALFGGLSMHATVIYFTDNNKLKKIKRLTFNEFGEL